MDTFAVDVGIKEGIAYEEENLCHLDIDDRDFGFRFVAEAERLVIWTVVCKRPPESGEVFLVQLLRANFMNQGIPDGALSLSDDDDVVAHCTLKMPVHLTPSNRQWSIRRRLPRCRRRISQGGKVKKT